MRKYILKRLSLMIITLFGITILSFIVIRLAPGNPADLLEQQGGEIVQKTGQASNESMDEFRRRYNLDKPLHIQYLTWIKKTILFDFGNSLIYKTKTVNELILERLPVTVWISFMTIFITYIIAVPIGVLTAVKENSLTDKTITVILFMLYSLPSFFVAIWCINLFANIEMLNWFPAQELEWNYPIGKLLYHSILPIFCSTLASYAYLSRQMRGSMLDVLRQDYIRTARAKGLSEKIVIFKHAIRNSLIPIITIASAILPELIGGSVIIESIFNIQGLGLLSFEAILARDYNVIMAIFYLSSLLTLVGILISDILYVLTNPRITFDERSE